MAIEAMKPQHQQLISNNFPLLESGKYQIRGTNYRKVVESMAVSSLLINDQSLVSKPEPVSEVLKNQITSTRITTSNLDDEIAVNVQESNKFKFNKVYSRIKCKSKEKQDSSSKQPCKLETGLLENQSTSIALGETQTKPEIVHHKEETRANMTISAHDDHNHDVSQNEAVHDDIVADFSNNEQKEKPWNLRQPKSYMKTESKELKRKLSIYLTRQECEEDLLLMSGGSKLPRKKKQKKSNKSNKKSRKMKAILDSLSPGLKFHGMSADTYKVTKSKMELG